MDAIVQPDPEKDKERGCQQSSKEQEDYDNIQTESHRSTPIYYSLMGYISGGGARGKSAPSYYWVVPTYSFMLRSWQANSKIIKLDLKLLSGGIDINDDTAQPAGDRGIVDLSQQFIVEK